jgi:CheY-like chemotaxis protein/two-component sensor histidine kinase
MIDSVDDFLTLSKLEDVSYQNKFTSLKMEQFVRELVLSFEPSITLKEQRLFYKSNIKSEVTIDFDYTSLKKIIPNLISNAIKYSHTKKTMHVMCSIEKGTLIFSVKDEGIGISEEEKNQIFSRFFQSEKETIVEGYGIGLSLVHELVTFMNGRIEVQSEKEVGSIFTVSIPLAIENYELYTHANPQNYELLIDGKEVLSIVEQKQDRPKVLIVDDNVEMVKYLKELLSSKFNCTYTSNGIRGLELVQQQPFNIIISDLRMPQMNGFEFKAALNELEGYKSIPFILLTATSLDVDNIDELVPGISDYMLKPFKNEELLTRIDHLIENSLYRESIQKISTKEVEFHGSYSELIKKIKKIVLLNMTVPEFNVKKLAQECGYTAHHLTLLIKEKVGLTPGKLILEIRLLKAYEDIINHKYLTLNEVIYSVGLSNRTYFNKVFQKRFGIRPNDLMKSKNIST